MNVKKQFFDGLINQNPSLVQLLGMCPLLAITTSMFNGLGMGLAVTIILTCSNVVISALRKIIPNKVRIACYIVVIAGFVTMVDLLLKGFVPALSESLGLFIPLIVVNCIILGRAEGFASKNSIGASALDGIFQGFGNMISLTIMSIIREFLGICPFMGVSKKVETALGMGMAVIFVMGVASAVNWPINEFLNSKGLGFMQTVTFILVIASLVQFVEMFLQKAMPSLYEALGVYLPLITTNCAVLGVSINNVSYGYNLIESVVYGVTGGLGFMLAIVLFASIRERLEFAQCPKSFEGIPLAMVTAGLMALAFMGFSGLQVW